MQEETARRNTRPVYLLAAKGRNELGGQWRCVGRFVHLDRDAAEDALPGFLERCTVPPVRISDPMPPTVTVSVVSLELVDSPDGGEPEAVTILSAEGGSAVHSGAFHAVFAKAFTDPRAAEDARPEFRARCLDPEGGFDHASGEALAISAMTLEVAARRPMEEPAAAGPRPG